MRNVKLTLISLFALHIPCFAQITSLTEISEKQAYLIKNANNFGYCIYNPQVSTEYATLGGATAVHANGCKNPLYLQDVTPTDTNNQWYIIPTGVDTYYLYNIGKGQYLTNKSASSWTGKGTYYPYSFQEYFFSDTPDAFTITATDKDTWAFRLKDATTDSNNSVEFKYMCAATQMSNAINVWSIDDPGSSWYVIDANNNSTEDKDDNKDEGNNNKDDNEADVEENLGAIKFFTLTDGQMIAIPEKYIAQREELDDQINLTLVGDTVLSIPRKHLASEASEYNGLLPEFESFKFNDKFNDQLYSDVEGDINQETHEINLEVACIGKRLVPSFKLPEGADAYVGGILQNSKRTSRRFEEVTTYTVAYPKNWIYRIHKVSDEVWSTPDIKDTEDQWIKTTLQLTESMLSTNAPSNQPENQGLQMMLDGNAQTYFHVTWNDKRGSNTPLPWSEGSTYGDGKSSWPYIEIAPAEPIQNFQFSYTAGPANRRWKSFTVQGSNNGTDWEDIEDFEEEVDALPTSDYGIWTSPILTNDHSFKHLRLQATSCFYKNYITLGELSFTRIEQNPEYGKVPDGFVPDLISPAVYTKDFVPYGTDYKVRVKYLTDHSTSQYNVPRIDINTFDGTMVSSKDYYWDASFRITGYGVFEDMYIESMQIKGRGNTSWAGASGKSPYRLKFAEKIKPFGLAKGKNWVLLANKQTGSMTSNAIAMKIADMVQTAGCNHIIPVELYINGNYRGSYNFTEKLGFSNNSIDLDDTSNAVLLELDSYYDEVYKFRDNLYNMYVNVKEPELAAVVPETNLSFLDIKNAFNNLTYDMKIAGGDVYAGDIDVNAFCKAMLVTDLTRNCEFKHPKSWYLYNEDIINDSLWVFGPVWDFDWAYGYDGTSQYYIYSAETDLFSGLTSSNIGFPFFRQLLRGSDVIKKAYYREWTEFLSTGRLDALLEYCDDYQVFADASYKHNATKWGDGNAYATHNANAKSWLTKRANYIYSHLDKFDLGEDIVDDTEEEFGQPDRVNVATLMSEKVDVYTIGGVRMRTQVPYSVAVNGLMPGIYIINGKKTIVR